MKIITEVRITTSISKAWDLLMDFSRYADWNPFIKSAQGSLEPGSKLNITLAIPGHDLLRPQVEVTGLRTEKYFSFHFSRMAPWIFAWEHVFRFTARENGDLFFHHEIYLTGLATRDSFLFKLLFPFLPRIDSHSLKQSMHKMNESFKEILESANRPS